MIVSWWFALIFINIIFFGLILEPDIEENLQKWLTVGLIVIDILMVIFMFRGM